jgi:protoporphyrinogen oxidase
MEIANPALEKAEIKLNQKVVRVETKNREMDGGKVVVITEKGESFEFDEVVMTTPLGWLKRNQGVSEDFYATKPLLNFASGSRGFPLI